MHIGMVMIVAVLVIVVMILHNTPSVCGFSYHTPFFSILQAPKGDK